MKIAFHGIQKKGFHSPLFECNDGRVHSLTLLQLDIQSELHPLYCHSFMSKLSFIASYLFLSLSCSLMFFLLVFSSFWTDSKCKKAQPTINPFNQRERKQQNIICIIIHRRHLENLKWTHTNLARHSISTRTKKKKCCAAHKNATNMKLIELNDSFLYFISYEFRQWF